MKGSGDTLKIIYLDCFSGISGDMLLGGLIDLGLDPVELKGLLGGLKLKGYSIHTESVIRYGIKGTRFIVEVEDSHPHRSLAEIIDLIEASEIGEGIRSESIEVFRRLAIAEGKVHGVDPDDVTFHEVGGVDSIIDIVGTIAALDIMGIEEVYSSPLPLGSGFVETAHGRLPVPAPATLEILKGYPVIPSTIEGELTTPTGAALVTHLSKGRMPPMDVISTGYGGGSRDIKEIPNLLRIVMGERAAACDTERLVVIETNIDDMTPAIYEYVMERLFKSGALDVMLIPVYMKKNRPGIMLWTLCNVKDRERIIEAIFSETTTIGLRSYEVDRHSLKRQRESFNSPYGRVWIKISKGKDDIFKIQPEYSDCKRIAEEQGVPLREVMEGVRRAYMNSKNKRD